MIMLARTASLAAYLLLAGTMCLSQENATHGARLSGLLAEVRKAADSIAETRTAIHRAAEAGDRERLSELATQMKRQKEGEAEIVRRAAQEVSRIRSQGDAAAIAAANSQLLAIVDSTSQRRLDHEPARGEGNAKALEMSEICYRPKKGENEWVEIQNASAGHIDASGFVLVGCSTGPIRLPTELSGSDPWTYVVVSFDPDRGEVSFLADNTVSVTRKLATVCGDMLPDAGGHLALYRMDDATDAADSRELASYVSWGLSPGMIVNDAVKGGFLRSPDLVPAGTYPCGIPGPQRPYVDGASLARSPRSAAGVDWAVFLPHEVSPGRPSGRQAPWTPPSIAQTPVQDLIAGWTVVQEDGVEYELQWARSRGFPEENRKVAKIRRHFHTIPGPFSDGDKLYWRVRAVYADHSFSNWCDCIVTFGSSGHDKRGVK